MFLAIAYVAPRLKQYGIDYPLALSLAALVASAGVYRLLSLSLRWLMVRSTRVNRQVLGAHYMHGTWIGWFEGHSKEKRYMVEHFVQDLEGLVISGRSFNAAQREHGYWESEATTIDAKRGRLVFTYKFDVLTQTSSLIGIHTSQFERTSAFSPPSSISGFAHDLNDPVRIGVHSEKLSDELMPWKDALEAAVARF